MPDGKVVHLEYVLARERADHVVTKMALKAARTSAIEARKRAKEAEIRYADREALG